MLLKTREKRNNLSFSEISHQDSRILIFILFYFPVEMKGSRAGVRRGYDPIQKEMMKTEISPYFRMK